MAWRVLLPGQGAPGRDRASSGSSGHGGVAMEGEGSWGDRMGSSEMIALMMCSKINTN